MKISDEEAWRSWKDNNTDPYGAAVVRYAERWADLMEAAMAEGLALQVVAKGCSNGADTEGITGFQYGMAVSVLATSWVHGDELRRWHNLDVQFGTEGERANESGGVLNPAMLNIGEPS